MVSTCCWYSSSKHMCTQACMHVDMHEPSTASSSVAMVMVAWQPFFSAMLNALSAPPRPVLFKELPVCELGPLCPLSTAHLCQL